MSKEAKHCNHILPNGEFCSSPALRGDDYCYFHRSSRERHKRQLRHARQQKPLEIGLLENLESVQLAIGDVLNALLAKRIDHKTAGLLLYGLQTAAGAVRHCHFNVWEDDESVARYTEYEQRTLDDEIEEEVRQEQRLAERARRKAAKTAAAAVQNPEAAPVPEPEEEEPAPALPDPGTDFPEKKPATRVSQKKFWSVVGDMAKQNAAEAARQLEKQLMAADEADEHLAEFDEIEEPPTGTDPK